MASNSFSALSLKTLLDQSNFTGNAFTELNLSALVSATQLSLDGNANLNAVLFDSLGSVEELEMNKNPRLHELEFPELSAAHSSMSLARDFSR